MKHVQRFVFVILAATAATFTLAQRIPNVIPQENAYTTGVTECDGTQDELDMEKTVDRDWYCDATVTPNVWRLRSEVGVTKVEDLTTAGASGTFPMSDGAGNLTMTLVDLTTDVEDLTTLGALGTCPVSDGAGNLDMTDVLLQSEVAAINVEDLTTAGADGTFPVSDGAGNITMTPVNPLSALDPANVIWAPGNQNESNHSYFGAYNRNQLSGASLFPTVTVTGSGDAGVTVSGEDFAFDGLSHTWATLGRDDVTDETVIEITNGGDPLPGMNILSNGAQWFVIVHFRGAGSIPRTITVDAQYDDGAGGTTWREVHTVSSLDNEYFHIFPLGLPPSMVSPYQWYGVRFKFDDWSGTLASYVGALGIGHVNENPWPQYVHTSGTGRFPIWGDVVLGGDADIELGRDGVAGAWRLEDNMFKGFLDLDDSWPKFQIQSTSGQMAWGDGSTDPQSTGTTLLGSAGGVLTTNADNFHVTGTGNLIHAGYDCSSYLNGGKLTALGGGGTFTCGHDFTGTLGAEPIYPTVIADWDTGTVVDIQDLDDDATYITHDLTCDATTGGGVCSTPSLNECTAPACAVGNDCSSDAECDGENWAACQCAAPTDAVAYIGEWPEDTQTTPTTSVLVRVENTHATGRVVYTHLYYCSAPYTNVNDTCATGWQFQHTIPNNVAFDVYALSVPSGAPDMEDYRVRVITAYQSGSLSGDWTVTSKVSSALWTKDIDNQNVVKNPAATQVVDGQTLFLDAPGGGVGVTQNTTLQTDGNILIQGISSAADKCTNPAENAACFYTEQPLGAGEDTLFKIELPSANDDDRETYCFGCPGGGVLQVGDLVNVYEQVSVPSPVCTGSIRQNAIVDLTGATKGECLYVPLKDKDGTCLWVGVVGVPDTLGCPDLN